MLRTLSPPTFVDRVAPQVLDLFDALPDVYLFVKDCESRFMRGNDAFLSLHGCESAAELLGKTDYDFHPPVTAAHGPPPAADHD
jgi:hypothetical protein